MILLGIGYAAVTGRLPDMTDAVLDSAKDAVTLGITMLGVLSFWTGMMKIAEHAGIIRRIEGWMRPLLDFLFPEIPQNHKARELIAENITANIFGLGWAATSSGLKAFEELQTLNPQKERATTAMCTMMILNISSLQLIPMNVIAYRSQYGSSDPAWIVGPAIAATFCSTIAGILFAKIAALLVRKR
jgi:spore maturation protein A